MPESSHKTPENKALYWELLDKDWETLPLTIRQFHGESGSHQRTVANGTFTIERKASFFVSRLGKWMGLPENAENIPTVLIIERNEQGEQWYRKFDSTELTTQQRYYNRGIVAETIKPFELYMSVQAVNGEMHMKTLTTALVIAGFPIALPPYFSPRVEARVWMQGQHMQVKVEVNLPLLGKVLNYHGTIHRFEMVNND